MARVVQGGRPPSSPKSHFAPLTSPTPSLFLSPPSLLLVADGFIWCRLIVGRGSGELEADRKKKKPGLPGATSEQSVEVSGDGRLCKLQNESGGFSGGEIYIYKYIYIVLSQHADRRTTAPRRHRSTPLHMYFAVIRGATLRRL